MTAFAFAATAFLAQPAMAQSSCKDLKKSTCTSRSTCTWVSGYVRKDKVKVASYCRKQFKPRKVPTCSASGYLACTRRDNCQWVAGYRKSDGTRVKGNCRVRAVKKAKTTKKRSTASSRSKACDTTNFILCQRQKDCRWVKGYKRSDGTTVKGRCRGK